jgi:hypothetical protein
MIALACARGKIGRIGVPADNDLIGKCPCCREWRRRFQVAQAERSGEHCHVCGVCGKVLDEGVPFWGIADWGRASVDKMG